MLTRLRAPPALRAAPPLTPPLSPRHVPRADDRLQMSMQLDATLRALGASAIVVGHTPQMGGLNSECDGRVWRVDAGMSSGVLNAEPQVLEFSRNAKGKTTARVLSAAGASAPAQLLDAAGVA